MSVKDPGNIFNLAQSGQELCRPWYILYGIFIENPLHKFFQISKLIFDTLLTYVPRWDNAPQAHSRVSNINFDIWKQIVEGCLYKYPMKNISRTAKFLPIFGKVKSIFRVFNWLKCLGGIMHFKPTEGCQISTLIFENKLWKGFSINIP
jgi:hypothetical protein